MYFLDTSSLTYTWTIYAQKGSESKSNSKIDEIAPPDLIKIIVLLLARIPIQYLGRKCNNSIKAIT